MLAQERSKICTYGFLHFPDDPHCSADGVLLFSNTGGTERKQGNMGQIRINPRWSSVKDLVSKHTECV